MRLRVTLHKLDVRQPGSVAALTRDVEHRCREIDPASGAVDCDRAPGCERRGSAPAPDVEHVVAGSELRRFQQRVGNRREHMVAAVGFTGPALATIAVPCLEGFGVRDTGHA